MYYKSRSLTKSSQTQQPQAQLAKMYLDMYYQARWRELNHYQSATKDRGEDISYHG